MSKLVINLVGTKFVVGPICLSCSNCLKARLISGGRYEIDCSKNPNLGGVKKTYSKCRSYSK